MSGQALRVQDIAPELVQVLQGAEILLVIFFNNYYDIEKGSKCSILKSTQSCNESSEYH